jgi:hypothetical protein
LEERLTWLGLFFPLPVLRELRLDPPERDEEGMAKLVITFERM